MKNVDVLFINPPFHIRQGSSNFFPLGLGYLISAIASQGYNYDVIDCSKIISSFFDDDMLHFKEQLNNKLKEYSPLLVGIGPCVTPQVRALKIIADCCKENFDDEIIYAGGPLTSISGQEWFFHEYLGIKYIMKGDGERAIINALTFLKSGKRLVECPDITTQFRVVYNFIPEIDAIPFPTRLDIDNAKVSLRRKSLDQSRFAAPMITSRGCPYKCGYCVSGNISDDKFRKRSNQNIIDEIRFLNYKFSIDDIIFYDDCFFYNPKRANSDIETFCDDLIRTKLNITWQMELRVDLVAQLSLNSILRLQESGCRQINIGIEKTNQASLKALNKNINIENLPFKIEEIKKHSNIKVAGTFILGGPDENAQEVKNTIKNAKKLNLDFAHFSPLFVYPGTPIYDMVFKDKYQWVEYILEDELPWGEIVFENKYLNKLELIELSEFAYSEFYKGTSYYDSFMIKNRYNLHRR